MREDKMIINNELSIIIKKIYCNVFLKFNEQYIVVFLCGGASDKNHRSLRDRVRKIFEEEKKTYLKKPFKIFYPEDLLIEVLNRTKNADLLSYERFLADNSHIVVVVCESPGSLVELGAFTNNNYTENKLIACIEKKYIKDKSFIVLGPVKYLKKKNKLNVIEYGQDEKVFAKQLAKNIREKHKICTSGKSMMSLTSIVGMHYFIQLLLYFFKVLEYRELVNIAKYTLNTEKLENDNFDILFDSSLKLLFQEKKINKISNFNNSSYKLTNLGIRTIKSMIDECKVSLKCDIIRAEVMFNEFYKSPHS